MPVPSYPPRFLAYAAAFIVSCIIFVAWYFLVPHRVPTKTRNELAPAVQTIQSQAGEILDRTKQVQTDLKEQKTQWRAEEEQKTTEEQARKAEIDASRQDLEAQGFRTTAPPTPSSETTPSDTTN